MSDTDASLDRDDFEGIVLRCEEETRAKFLDKFSDEADQIIDGLFKAHRSIKGLTASLEADMRAAWVEAFLFAALDGVATSAKLFLMGLVIPSGMSLPLCGRPKYMA